MDFPEVPSSERLYMLLKILQNCEKVIGNYQIGRFCNFIPVYGLKLLLFCICLSYSHMKKAGDDGGWLFARPTAMHFFSCGPMEKTTTHLFV